MGEDKKATEGEEAKKVKRSCTPDPRFSLTPASYQKHITLVGNRLSRPKVILSETSVMSPEIFSQLTQNFNKECM